MPEIEQANSLAEPKLPGNKQNGSSDREQDYQGFLRELGLIGLEELELPLLCSLVTGDPLLMVGTHGTAKTALADKVASALGLEFHAYDASKALFEDIIGFPNPSALENGELDYVPTSISLWEKEFILVDEISRATAQTQSKWLEVIRSRNLMGKQLDQLQYIVSAMNPPGDYQGASPLDPAMAGRFAFIVEMPSVSAMSDEERTGIMQTVGEDDAPLAGELFSNEKQTANNSSLQQFVNNIRNRLPAVVESHGDTVNCYLNQVIESVSVDEEERKHLDGRRLGMIRRNALAALAVPPEPGPAEIDDRLHSVLFQSLPHVALGKPLPEHRYELAHQDAVTYVLGDHHQSDRPKLNGQELLNRALDPDTPREALDELASLSRVFEALTGEDENLEVSPETVGRLLTTANSLFDKVPACHKSKQLTTKWVQGGSPCRDIATVLLAWWLVENEQEGTFRVDRNNAERTTDLIFELTKRIKQRRKDD